MIENLFKPTHLLLVLIICIFVFGPKKLPELGKALGDGIRGFKDGMNPSAPPPASNADNTKAQAENTSAK